jgi:hypothetical protein
MLFELTITDELREMLNNQDELHKECTNKIDFMPYHRYTTICKEENSITTQFLNLLFSQHTFFNDMKDDLIITTSKSGIMTTNGLNGEGNWHKDNILFPNEKQNNLIITWNGNGTSCLSEEDTKWITDIQTEFILSDRTDYDNYPKIDDIDLKYITSHYSVDSNHMKLLSTKGKEIFHRRNPLNESDIGKLRYVLNIYYN